MTGGRSSRHADRLHAVTCVWEMWWDEMDRLQLVDQVQLQRTDHRTAEYWSVSRRRRSVNARVSDNYYQTGCVARPPDRTYKSVDDACAVARLYAHPLGRPPIHLDSTETRQTVRRAVRPSVKATTSATAAAAAAAAAAQRFVICTSLAWCTSHYYALTRFAVGWQMLPASSSHNVRINSIHFSYCIGVGLYIMFHKKQLLRLLCFYFFICPVKMQQIFTGTFGTKFAIKRHLERVSPLFCETNVVNYRAIVCCVRWASLAEIWTTRDLAYVVKIKLGFMDLDSRTDEYRTRVV